MHEYSIVEALLKEVDRAAQAQKAVAVHRLKVRIGELAGVERDLLKTAFDTFREQTLCAHAELEIIPVAARWVCRGCGEALAGGGILRCGQCGMPARLEAGDEILLEQIEMEVDDV
jgi:hydrogenase nickel incorporation protein HypA/HybF